MEFKKILKEITQECDCYKDVISEGLMYHYEHDLPLTENIYRPSSMEYFNLFTEARALYEKGYISLNEEESSMLENTDLGNFGYYNGIKVPLDFPMSVEQLTEAKHQGKEVQLNKPKRGGSKKFYVFVKKPGGGIKKVSFGDTTGLKAKINDPKARSSFSKRHNCPEKKDKTTPGYWACRLPKYSKLLGLKSNFTGYW